MSFPIEFKRASNARSRMRPILVRPRKKNSSLSNKSASRGNIITAQRANGTEIIQRTLPLFPVRTTKTVRYSSSFALASTAGAVTSYVWAANGLFDPDVTGTGHQPLGFDEMMIYFNHYTVIRSRCQLIAKGVSSSKMTACLRYDGAPTPLTVIDRIVEIGGGVIEYLELGTTSLATKRLALAIDIANAQGVSPSAITADTSLRGTSAANPSELTYYHVQVWDSAGQTGTVNFDIVLEFDAIFTEPRDGTQSISDRIMELKRSHTIHLNNKLARAGETAMWR